MSREAWGDPPDRDFREEAEANQDRSATAVAAPPGWKLVPVEPTEAMHEAAVRTIVRCTGNDDFPPRVYRAMLAAAPEPVPAHESGFTKALEHTINCHSMENGSNTPDFILASYLATCLAAFDAAVRRRQHWMEPVPVAQEPEAAPSDQADARHVGWFKPAHGRMGAALHKRKPGYDDAYRADGWQPIYVAMAAPAGDGP